MQSELKAHPSLDQLPEYMTREQAARVITEHFFPISDRTLEKWPLRGRRVSGKLMLLTADVIAEARRRMEEAPLVQTGKPAKRAA
ncbi:hypothetical protein M0638_28410 [Roseomonas sp. NAR14]|uniref:Uncharacterized protein n=1 Tax=Roseomonas acroporae TaxID=2937791 RepID=A0A9X2BZT7_9PROT|nr:hypothetical protein [Roseomonas acroporae]MCK8788279.1 hypothetical protein [Roseomonas acroporae]